MRLDLNGTELSRHAALVGPSVTIPGNARTCLACVMACAAGCRVRHHLWAAQDPSTWQRTGRAQVGLAVARGGVLHLDAHIVAHLVPAPAPRHFFNNANRASFPNSPVVAHASSPVHAAVHMQMRGGLAQMSKDCKVGAQSNGSPCTHRTSGVAWLLPSASSRSFWVMVPFSMEVTWWHQAEYTYWLGEHCDEARMLPVMQHRMCLSDSCRSLVAGTNEGCSTDRTATAAAHFS